MVAYDYSREPDNPWDRATWSPKAQIDFSRRMRALHMYDGSAETRILQRIEQSDTKGIPPRPERPQRPPFQVIIQKRVFVQTGSSPPPDPGLGFWAAGTLISNGIYTLAVTPLNMQFPGDPTVDLDLASCRSAPTGSVALRLMSNPLDDTTLICTVSFAAGVKTGTFNYVPTLSSPLVIPAGTTLYLVAPVNVDPTFIGISIQFGGALT